ncbi:MAG: hypothetical protein ABJB61_10245 [bacterium]
MSVIVASGGQLPMRYVQPASRELSARSKGVRQGALLMLSTLLVVPVIAILSVYIIGAPHIFVPIAALFCFVGGLLRMLYALMMEDTTAPIDTPQISTYAPPMAPQLESQRSAASAQASLNAAPAWRPQPNTGQILTPPSVTENTTRLLNKEDPQDR